MNLYNQPSCINHVKRSFRSSISDYPNKLIVNHNQLHQAVGSFETLLSMFIPGNGMRRPRVISGVSG
jgi:hypothetical protein